MNATTLESMLDEFAERVAAKVTEKLASGGMPGALDQSRSPLGRRRHIAAARRRIASGQPGAAQVGRRYLMSPEALSEELARTSGRHVDPPAPASGSVRAELESALRVVKGGRS